MTTLVSQRWNQSLNAIHNPMPADSLIPMFEGMVDASAVPHPSSSSGRGGTGASSAQPAPKPAVSIPTPAKSLAHKA